MPYGYAVPGYTVLTSAAPQQQPAPQPPPAPPTTTTYVYTQPLPAPAHTGPSVAPQMLPPPPAPAPPPPQIPTYHVTQYQAPQPPNYAPGPPTHTAPVGPPQYAQAAPPVYHQPPPQQGQLYPTSKPLTPRSPPIGGQARPNTHWNADSQRWNPSAEPGWQTGNGTGNPPPAWPRNNPPPPQTRVELYPVSQAQKPDFPPLQTAPLRPSYSQQFMPPQRNPNWNPPRTSGGEALAPTPGDTLRRPYSP